MKPSGRVSAVPVGALAAAAALAAVAISDKPHEVPAAPDAIESTGGLLDTIGAALGAVHTRHVAPAAGIVPAGVVVTLHYPTGDRLTGRGADTAAAAAALYARVRTELPADVAAACDAYLSPEG